MKPKKYGILYVDDEIIYLKTFNSIFRRSYNVFTAQSGLEGLEILAREKIELVISDQQMPGMSGVEFLQNVLSKYPNTIRLILTGQSNIETVIDIFNKLSNCRISFFFIFYT